MKWVNSGECYSLSFLFHFSRKIKESLECFPVKLNNLIHTLAQMTAINPAKSTSQTFSRESCTMSATQLIQRATILGFSKKTRHVSLKSVILTYISFDYISHFPSLCYTFLLIPWFFFFATQLKNQLQFEQKCH